MISPRSRRLAARIGRPFRVFAVEVGVRFRWDRRRCRWCGEELRWSLAGSRTTSRVGREVHAECLHLADNDEEARAC